MYVWLDALTNYLTGVNGLGTNGDDSDVSELKHFWPASVHIIGKDILWFHTVIWPCLLMSAGLPLPRTVFAHGFVNDGEGKKMSKSIGNVVDPHDMLDKFEADTFRWQVECFLSFSLVQYHILTRIAVFVLLSKGISAKKLRTVENFPSARTT